MYETEMISISQCDRIQLKDIWAIYWAVTFTYNMYTWFESELFGLMNKEERRDRAVLRILGLDKAQILFMVIFTEIPEISGARWIIS